MKNQETVTLRMNIQRETEKAVLVYGLHESPHENYGLDCWLPKSMILIENQETVEAVGGMKIQMADVVIPAWLSRKNTVMLNNPKGHYNR